MSKKSVEAARKAEEALRNAERLEKEAIEARAVAEKAMKEAKQSGKSKKNEKSNSLNRKFVLDYLQKNAWDLHKQLNNVNDIRFEDNPPRVVMVVVPGPNGTGEPPSLVHNGVEIPVELEVKTPSTVMVGENINGKNSIITEDKVEKDDDEVYYRSVTGKAAETLGIKEAIGPHSVDKNSKQRKAYAAWVKRHSGVKIQKD